MRERSDETLMMAYADGKLNQELAAFREAYPHYVLPPELRD